MHRHLSVLLLLCFVAAVPAQTEQSQVTPPEPEILPPPVLDRSDATKMPPSSLAELRRALEQLQVERVTLLAEQQAAAELTGPRSGNPDPETAQLRLRLGELLLKLGTRRPGELSSKATPPQSQEPSKSKTAPDKKADQIAKETTTKQAPGPFPAELDTDRPLDAASLGHALFRTGEYATALKAFQQVKLTGLKAEERMPVQYLIATCLRKLGKREEAATLYREVANSRGDEQVALCAQWQLSNLRWRTEIEGRLAELQGRRKSLEEKR